MKPYYYSILSAAIALSALSSCKQYDEVNPRTCQAETTEGLPLFNKGKDRATTDNKTKYDEGYKAGKEGLTREKGFADGKAVIYKQKYDAAYSAAYTPAYNTAFSTAYNNIANYNQGYSVGQAKGSAEGAANGSRDGTTKGYNDAKVNADYAADLDAKDDGYYYGVKEGNDDGIAEGKYYGAKEGAEQGAADGYDDGYADGYEVGAEACDLNAQYSTPSSPNGKIVPPKIEDIRTQCEQVGYNATVALQANYNQGYADGKAANTEYQAGYADGLKDQATIDSATSSGTSVGKSNGEKDGSSAGATKRYNEGYTAGYNSTYTAAYNAAFGPAVSNAYWANYNALYNSFYASYYDYYYEYYYTAAYNPQYSKFYTSYYNSAYATAYDDYYDEGYYDGLDDADYDCSLIGGRKAAKSTVARIEKSKTFSIDGQKVLINKEIVLSNRIQISVQTGFDSTGKKVVVSSTAQYPVSNFKNVGVYGLGKYKGSELSKQISGSGDAKKAAIKAAAEALRSARKARLTVDAQARQNVILKDRRDRATAKYNEFSTKWPDLVKQFRGLYKKAEPQDPVAVPYKFHWERK